MEIHKLLPDNPHWEYDNNPDSMMLHHAEAKNCSIFNINQWHLENGWCGGCGYHYLVRKNGDIFAGRPEKAIGAHCPGYNDHSIGICAEGDYMTETMSDAQFNSIVALCKDIKSRYKIINIYGHGQVYQTSCPGENYPLEKVKKAVKTNVTNANEAILLLQSKGVINSPDYWITAITIVKNLDQLLINMANKIA